MALTTQKQKLINEVIELLKLDNGNAHSIISKSLILADLCNDRNHELLFKAHLDGFDIASEQETGNGELSISNLLPPSAIQAFWDDRTNKFGEVFGAPLDEIENFLRNFPTKINRSRQIGNYSEANELTKLRLSYSVILTKIKKRVELFVEKIQEDYLTKSVYQGENVALILKGGGVKGLALVGAIAELVEYYPFNAFVGTSAGAIVAGLLAAECSVEELEKILRNTEFQRFQDTNFYWGIKNLIFHRHLYSGEAFENWIWEQIKAVYNDRTGNVKAPRLKDLNQRLTIYASQEGEGAVVFDSGRTSETKNNYLTFAIRCSMSIPVFFKPPMYEGKPIYDGGLLNNFPAEDWLRNNPDYKFVGVFLGPKAVDPKGSGSLSGGITSIVTDQNYLNFIDMHRENVVVVDPDPVGTTDFNISTAEANFLVLQGRADALEHLQRYLPEGKRPGLEVVQDIQNKANAAKVIALAEREKRRKRTKIKRILALTAVIFVFAALIYMKPFIFNR